MVFYKSEPLLLIADDQPDNLRAIIQILKSSEQNYKFITVPNGKILVELALSQQPDLIITDWEMPEMTGLEAIVALKKNQVTQDIPVIMCTGIMITPEDLKIAMEAGAVDFVRKPVDAMELIARVQSMLALSASYRKIKEQKEELEISNQLKNRLLSVVSHDVRSPLNTLKGIFFLFEKESLTPEEIKELLLKIGFQVSQVTDFLENLLHWAKNQILQSPANFTRIQLGSLLKITIDLLKSTAENKKINLITQIDELILVNVDEEMIKIVVRNLVSNAIKFCNEGDTIQVIIQKDTVNQKVKVSVKDTGLGMSSEHLQKLFGVQHLSTKGTGNEIGTGLGLILSKEYITKNHGEIGVESEEGKGSHFWFTLPI
jgi:two-component system, sensor histidine kinase and response regulator